MFNHFSNAAKKPIIPATDPKKISNLWQQVMEAKEIPSSQTSKDNPKSHPSQTKQTASSQDSYPSNTSSSKSREISIDNPDFRSLILAPRWISVDRLLSRIAFEYFGTSRPTQRYQDLPGLESTAVWLESNTSFIPGVVSAYKEMKELGLCEAEYAQYTMENFFKGERPNVEPTRPWKTRRLIELEVNPEELWKSPPVLDVPPAKDYNFDIRPDVSYWIPIEAFNEENTNYIEELVLVRHERFLCPYLTIQFKKEDPQDEEAENQIAIAGSIALYNRFLLKERRLRKKNQDWTDQHLAPVKHYGITFSAEEVGIWCIRPRPPLSIHDLSHTWTGCVMERVFRSPCTQEARVQMLADWINEIHRWGMTTHADSCQRDLERYMDAMGVRTSLGDSEEARDSDTEPEAGS